MHSLRARLTSSLLAIVVTLVAVSSVCITSLTRLGGAIAVILRENYASVIACEDMKEALAREDSAAQFATTGHGDTAAQQLATHRAAFAAAFAREARNVTLPGEAARVREIDQAYQDYLRASDRVLADPAVAARADAYFRELLPRFTHIDESIQAVLRMNQANMVEADAAAKAMARRSVRIALTVSVLAVLLAIWFAWRLPRGVVAPIHKLATAARAIGEGNLNISVEDSKLDELNSLSTAFGKMVGQLRTYRQSSLGELLAAQDLANATIACLLDPVVVFGANGEILLANEAAERTFELRAGSLEELRVDDIHVPEAFTAARDRVVTSGEVVAPRNFSEAVRWRGRGPDRFFLLRAAPLAAADGDDGASRRVLVVAQDVTRFRRIDELKSGMVATVSHEFKTPLTSLRMATHLLLEPTTGPLNTTQQEIVTTARDDTERLRTLVDELLDLVRIESEAGALRCTAVDPMQLLASVAEAHRSIAHEKGVTLEVVPSEAPARVNVDPEKMSIVLANLVSNAIRHTPPNGTVQLRAQRDGGAFRFHVRDTGEGISRDQLPTLLERGARKSTAGSGRHALGLAIAHEIVLQHGGDLTVESAVGRGSEFTVVVPESRPSDPPPARRARETS